MSDELPQTKLLDEIDSRQDEILQELDNLNARVEGLLKQWTVNKQDENAVQEPSS